MDKVIIETSNAPEYITKGNTVFVLRTVYSGEKSAKELIKKAVESIILEQSKSSLEFPAGQRHNGN